MKFWELVSIFRDRPELLRRVLAQDRWRKYFAYLQDFDFLVMCQDRAALDEVIPEDLAREAMAASGLWYHVQNNNLYECGPEAEGAMSGLVAYNRFGGTVLEDVREKGCFPLSWLRP